jgi:hypothetical protein
MNVLHDIGSFSSIHYNTGDQASEWRRYVHGAMSEVRVVGKLDDFIQLITGWLRHSGATTFSLKSSRQINQRRTVHGERWLTNAPQAIISQVAILLNHESRRRSGMFATCKSPPPLPEAYSDQTGHRFRIFVTMGTIHWVLFHLMWVDTV